MLTNLGPSLEKFKILLKGTRYKDISEIVVAVITALNEAITGPEKSIGMLNTPSSSSNSYKNNSS